MTKIDFLKEMKQENVSKNKDAAETAKKKALDINIETIDEQINELTKAAIEAENTGSTRLYETIVQSLAHLCDVSAKLKIAKIDIKVANIAINANTALFDALNTLESIAKSGKSGQKLNAILKKQKVLAKEFAEISISQRELGKALDEGSSANYMKNQESMQTALALINAQKDAERMQTSVDIQNKNSTNMRI